MALSDNADLVAKADPLTHADKFWCEEPGVEVLLVPTDSGAGLVLAIRMENFGHVEIRGGTLAWYRLRRLAQRILELEPPRPNDTASA